MSKKSSHSVPVAVEIDKLTNSIELVATGDVFNTIVMRAPLQPITATMTATYPWPESGGVRETITTMEDQFDKAVSAMKERTQRKEDLFYDLCKPMGRFFQA